MNRCRTFTPRRRLPSRQRGAALVVGLLLMLVLTLLAISGMTTASNELQMAGNEQYRERAFQAADAGLERAIKAGVYDKTATIGTYMPSVDPNLPPTPQRGSGVAGCMRTIADDGSLSDTDDCYEYFMRFDEQTGTTPVPGDVSTSGVQAYHFVVDAYGTSNRGAVSHLTQSFYIVGPTADPDPDDAAPSEPAPTCAVDPESCATALASKPVRTYWRQAGAG
jgi:type IV pilus assembly protein PilX